MDATPSSTNADLMAAVLLLLSEVDRPTGASVIHEHLLLKGFQLSEPTVGRLLRELDRRGYTTSEGRLGRLLTTAGREQLQRLEDRSSRDLNTRRLMDALRADTLADIINVLVARRGIEREMARAAALNATPDEIEVLREHDRSIRRGETVEGLHHLLAPAAHNPVLDSVYRLITHDPDVSRLVNQLMQNKGKFFDLPFNNRLIKAIERHDPDAAESAVIEHIDEVLAVAEEAWSAVRRKERGKDRGGGRTAKARAARA
jgi:GntR family L-lactate dehydrogenase operon transcriptional regulator